MLVKVCGLRSKEDLLACAEAGADYAGMIFSESSPRFAGNHLDEKFMPGFAAGYPRLKRVGVFVNAESAYVLSVIRKYRLNAIQLHGNESPGYCAFFTGQCEVIKAISIVDESDFALCRAYVKTCDKFLFDTKGKSVGGNGTKWNWELLRYYLEEIPFLLSGGIALEDAPELKAFRHPQLSGVDINSRFETAPGVKDMERVSTFIGKIKTEQHAIHG